MSSVRSPTKREEVEGRAHFFSIILVAVESESSSTQAWDITFWCWWKQQLLLLFCGLLLLLFGELWPTQSKKGTGRERWVSLKSDRSKEDSSTSHSCPTSSLISFLRCCWANRVDKHNCSLSHMSNSLRGEEEKPQWARKENNQLKQQTTTTTTNNKQQTTTTTTTTTTTEKIFFWNCMENAY